MQVTAEFPECIKANVLLIYLPHRFLIIYPWPILQGVSQTLGHHTCKEGRGGAMKSMVNEHLYESELGKLLMSHILVLLTKVTPTENVNLGFNLM